MVSSKVPLGRIFDQMNFRRRRRRRWNRGRRRRSRRRKRKRRGGAKDRGWGEKKEVEEVEEGREIMMRRGRRHVELKQGVAQRTPGRGKVATSSLQ